MMNKLGIAVIHDVKHVELITLRPQPPRIIPEPVQDSVGIEQRFRLVGIASSKSPSHGRAEPNYLKIALKFLQTLLKHESYEVHARPILLKEVTDNSYLGHSYTCHG